MSVAIATRIAALADEPNEALVDRAKAAMTALSGRLRPITPPGATATPGPPAWYAINRALHELDDAVKWMTAEQEPTR